MKMGILLSNSGADSHIPHLLSHAPCTAQPSSTQHLALHSLDRNMSQPTLAHTRTDPFLNLISQFMLGTNRICTPESEWGWKVPSNLITFLRLDVDTLSVALKRKTSHLTSLIS